MYSDPNEYHRVTEPAQKAYGNPYEDNGPYHGIPDIPPPPPPPRPRHTGRFVVVASIILLSVMALSGVFIGVMQHSSAEIKPQVTQETAVSTPIPTSQPTIIIETATPDIAASPVPAIASAWDIYTRFTNAGIAMGNAGDVFLTVK